MGQGAQTVKLFIFQEMSCEKLGNILNYVENMRMHVYILS